MKIAILSSFVTGESWLIFKLVGIEPTFLCKPPSTWGDDHSSIQLKPIVTSLKVINDAAERTVKFGSDFGEVTTKNYDAETKHSTSGTEPKNVPRSKQQNSNSSLVLNPG